MAIGFEQQLIMSYFAIIFMFIAVINALMNNFLLVWATVKLGGGRKIMLWVYTVTGSIPKSAKISENYCMYKHKKKKHYVQICRKAIYRSLKIDCMDISDDSPVPYKRNSKNTIDFDKPTFDNILVRALTKPTLGLSMPDKMILIALFGVGAIGLLNWYSISNIEQSIGVLSQKVGSMNLTKVI